MTMLLFLALSMVVLARALVVALMMTIGVFAVVFMPVVVLFWVAEGFVRIWAQETESG